MDDEELEGNAEWQNQSSSMGYGMENLSEEEIEERRDSKNNYQNYNQENSHNNAQDSEKEEGNNPSNGNGNRKEASSNLEDDDDYSNLDRKNDTNDDEERKPLDRKKRGDIGAPITLGRRLYIGNLDGVVTESDIRAVFDEFGKIITLFIPERGDGRKKYALLTFNEAHEADSAMKELFRRSKIENGESVSGEDDQEVEDGKIKEFYLTINSQRVKIEWSSHIKNKEKRNPGRLSNSRRGDYNSRPRQGWDRRDNYYRDRDDYRYRDNYREGNYRDRDGYYYDRDRDRERDRDGGPRRDPRDYGGGGYGRGDRDSYRPPSYRNEDFDRDRNSGYRSYGSRDREREAPPRDYYRSDYERDLDRGRERGREGERERVGSWDEDANRSRRRGYSDSYRGRSPDRDDQYRRDRNEF